MPAEYPQCHWGLPHKDQHNDQNTTSYLCSAYINLITYYSHDRYTYQIKANLHTHILILGRTCMMVGYIIKFPEVPTGMGNWEIGKQMTSQTFHCPIISKSWMLNVFLQANWRCSFSTPSHNSWPKWSKCNLQFLTQSFFAETQSFNKNIKLFIMFK